MPTSLNRAVLGPSRRRQLGSRGRLLIPHCHRRVTALHRLPVSAWLTLNASLTRPKGSSRATHRCAPRPLRLPPPHPPKKQNLRQPLWLHPGPYHLLCAPHSLFINKLHVRACETPPSLPSLPTNTNTHKRARSRTHARMRAQCPRAPTFCPWPAAADLLRLHLGPPPGQQLHKRLRRGHVVLTGRGGRGGGSRDGRGSGEGGAALRLGSSSAGLGGGGHGHPELAVWVVVPGCIDDTAARMAAPGTLTGMMMGQLCRPPPPPPWRTYDTDVLSPTTNRSINYTRGYGAYVGHHAPVGRAALRWGAAA